LLYGHPFIIFITLPLGCLSRICLIKTLPEKNPMGKKISEGKRVPGKPSGIKPWLREKECRTYFCLPLIKTII